MKKFLFTLSIILLPTIPLCSQDKLFTLEDCININRDLFPTSIQNLQWIPESNFYSYIKNDTLFKGNVKSNKDEVVLTNKTIENSFADQSVLLKDKYIRLSAIKWKDKENFTFSTNHELYNYNINTKIVTSVNQIPDGSNLDISNTSKYYAYTIEDDLFIMKNGAPITVAESDKEGLIYGAADAHRNEFGITKGTFWSPNDNYLAFYRMDESMVTNYPMIDITGRIATVVNTRYPMAGMTSHNVTLGVYNINTGNTTYIKTGEPVDQYLTLVTWDPSEKYIYIGILNRDQNHLQFNKYDVATGNLLKTLFEETDKEYVEPQFNPEFICKSEAEFIWQSRRDGWNHLYLYDNEGNLLKQITKGDWEVTGIIGFTAKYDKLIFSATKDSPIENNIYSVDMKSGAITRLSKDHGTHQAVLSSAGYLIDNYSSTDVTNKYNIVDMSGKIIKTLLDAADPLANYALGKVTIGTLTNNNGDDLYYRMITPPNFDPSKKYPVFFYVYGGPHLQMITDNRNGGTDFWDYRWAQRGYIVFSMDNRGTPNRGADFEQAIHRNLGVLELEDQTVGINYLKSLPYVDSNKMAVDGWSYGGFMTTSLMLKRPDVFKVGVAGGPVIDWKWYEVMYGERYMDTPQDNPEGYANASLLNYVENLKGKLLMIHCVTDPVVVMQNSLAFIDTCIKSGVQVDYFVYPGHEHNVRGIDRVHLYQKIESYIDSVLAK